MEQVSRGRAIAAAIGCALILTTGTGTTTVLNAMIPDDDPGVLVPHEVGDGGLLLMPTRANIPDPQRDDWKPATCPICGAECWETEIHRQALAAEPGLRAVCTDCGLRGAAGVGLVDTSSKKEEKDHE